MSSAQLVPLNSLPIFPNQEPTLFQVQMLPGQWDLYVAFPSHLIEALDLFALHYSLTKTSQHKIQRTTFRMHEGQPFQQARLTH